MGVGAPEASMPSAAALVAVLPSLVALSFSSQRIVACKGIHAVSCLNVYVREREIARGV